MSSRALPGAVLEIVAMLRPGTQTGYTCELSSGTATPTPLDETFDKISELVLELPPAPVLKPIFSFDGSGGDPSKLTKKRL